MEGNQTENVVKDLAVELIDREKLIQILLQRAATLNAGAYEEERKAAGNVPLTLQMRYAARMIEGEIIAEIIRQPCINPVITVQTEEEGGVTQRVSRSVPSKLFNMVVKGKYQ